MATEAEVLARHFPEFVASEMDHSSYWKSLEEYKPGDVITHNGTDYVVNYSWPWWKPRTIQVYMAALEPLEAVKARVARQIGPGVAEWYAALLRNGATDKE